MTDTTERAATPCMNAWFLSLPKVRQAVLRDDKWMLAHAAYDAGRAAQPVTTPHQSELAALRDAAQRARDALAVALVVSSPDMFATDADIAGHSVIKALDAALAASPEAAQAAAVPADVSEPDVCTRLGHKWDLHSFVRTDFGMYRCQHCGDERVTQTTAPPLPEGCQCKACATIPHASDCAVHNAPAYPPGSCTCMVLVPREATKEMMVAAVKFANGPAVYKNVAAGALEIEEQIYGETWDAMVAAATGAAQPATQTHHPH